MTARHRIGDRNVLVIEIWDFDIIWNLSIVIWDLSAVFGKANRFYLNYLEAEFDVSLVYSALKSTYEGSYFEDFTAC